MVGELCRLKQFCQRPLCFGSLYDRQGPIAEVDMVYRAVDMPGESRACR